MNFINLNPDLTKDNILGLTDELKGLYISDLFNKQDKSILLVVNSLYEANYFYHIIENFNKNVCLFPMDDFLTSVALASSPELKTTRLETINEILNKEKTIVVTNLIGYLKFLPTKEAFVKSQLNLKKGSEISLSELTRTLFDIGYEKDVVVNKTGDIAVRGFVVDIFPITYNNPIRLEFFGDEITSIREFDLNSQLTIKEIDGIEILPNTETLKNNNSSLSSLFHEVVTIFNDIDTINVGYERLQEEIFAYNNEKNVNEKYIFDLNVVKPNDALYFINLDNTTSKKQVHYNAKEVDYFNGDKDYINNRLNKYLEKLDYVVICMSSIMMANKLTEELENSNIIVNDIDSLEKGKINVVEFNLKRGFEINNIGVISEVEIYNKKYKSESKYKSNFKIGSRVKDISKLDPGDYVVHEIYGIGKYLGLKTVSKGDLTKDYLQIEYRNEDKLYIPVERIDLITKYASNDGSAPRLSKLGGIEWVKTKERVRKQINDMAEDLLKLYSLRETKIGHAFSKDTEDQLLFESSFEFNETEDQVRVIKEIKEDMEKPYPMDRLLCGDVGFGKTEVAFRAMFKAIMDHKQVAFLAPTTILSNQHFNNAIQRFKDFAINIEVLNRLVPPKKQKQILNDLKEGKVDLLIGTHRILSEDIKFKDIGLLVVDEEQRFGVKHKEKIKTYKNSIDVLTLTATPIPRTLQMAMTGLRSLSLIETPPTNRYPVQTYALAENNLIIKDAIYKELSRDGQIYILYNNIELMQAKVAEIERLVPQARVIHAHGQMNKKELEDVMLKFVNKDFDVLVSTTIIETGIDIPNVNTLIIIDSDRFGLSQLYQIRGRVGRSDRIAYCYLMYKQGKIITEIANKRLSAIKEFTELGSGLSIAMRDLAIRGAGDILGGEQAGYVSEVGIELFMKMMETELAKINGTYVEEENETVMPLIEVDTSISEDYVSDEDLRILIHKKINEIDSYDKLVNVKAEIEDRFGVVDEKTLIYMYEEWFDKISSSIEIERINQTKNSIEVILSKDLTNSIDGEKMFIKISNLSKMFRFKMKFNRLNIILDTVKLEKHFIFYLIELVTIIKESIKKD